MSLSKAWNRSSFVPPMKTKSAGGHDRAAKVFGSGLRHAAGLQLGIFSQRHAPGELARVEIDRIEHSPGRLDCRVALVIAKLHVPRVAVGAV